MEDEISREPHVDGLGNFYMYLPQGKASYDADTLARLQLVKTCSNGFDLAEQDMLRRGFGTFVDADGSARGY